jgi:S-adenosylmethionine:tRNA ribosyltransferase-isomerase
MTPARHPTPRPRDAKLLLIDAQGGLQHTARERLVDVLAPGDLLVANDAATLPASLHGTHSRTGLPIEVRLAGRRSLAVDDVHEFSAVVFGAGDHRTRTEERALPPELRAGDALVLGPLRAVVQRLLGHHRLISLRLHGTPDVVWAGIARHGKPVQYAHIHEPLALWDVWTRVAALPVAFEPPSAGFLIDWKLLHALRERGVGFATLTHAAGLSSTGDAALDERLPFDEPYHLPLHTVQSIERTHALGARVIALGTTVTRALEHAASLHWPLRAGFGVANQRIGARTPLRVVDAIISGTHEPGSSHHDLLRAFISAAVLARADRALAAGGYRSHEFGDSVLIERERAGVSARTAQVALAPEIQAQAGAEHQHEGGSEPEAARAVNEGQAFEVHAEETGHQVQRQEDRGQHGQRAHDLAGAVALRREVHLHRVLG